MPQIISIFFFGILGAFIAIVLGGFSAWTLSVAPEFFVWKLVIFLFPVPLVLGVVASLISSSIENKYGRTNGKMIAFLFAFISTFLSIPATPLLGTFVFESIFNNPNQSQVIALHILVGTSFIFVFAFIKFSKSQIEVIG